MNADEGVQPDRVTKFAEEGAVGAGDQRENDDFEANQRKDPFEPGASDRIANTGYLGLLAYAEIDRKPKDEEEPQVGTIATEWGGEMMDKDANGK